MSIYRQLVRRISSWDSERGTCVPFANRSSKISASWLSIISWTTLFYSSQRRILPSVSMTEGILMPVKSLTNASSHRERCETSELILCSQDYANNLPKLKRRLRKMATSQSILMMIRIKSWKINLTKSPKKSNQNCFSQGRVMIHPSQVQLKGKECKQKRRSPVKAWVLDFLWCLLSHVTIQSLPWVQKYRHLIALHTPRSWSGTSKKITKETSIGTSLPVADTSTILPLLTTCRRMTSRSRESTILRFGCTCVMEQRSRHATRTHMPVASSTSCASMSL